MRRSPRQTWRKGVPCVTCKRSPYQPKSIRRSSFPRTHPPHRGLRRIQDPPTPGSFVWTAKRQTRSSKRHKRLCEHTFLLSKNTRPLRTTSLDTQAGSPMGSSMASPKYGLYDYQRQVMLDTIQGLEQPRGVMDPYPRVLLHLPTGAGKTRIATHIACELLNRSPDDALIVWLASGTELLEQATGELSRGWRFLGRSEIYVHRFWGNQNLRWDNLHGGFLVAGLSKLRWVDSGNTRVLDELGHRVRAVIFDEAHQAPANTYEYVVEQLVGHGGALIGLTATPGRGWGLSDEDERLATLFQTNRIEIDSRGHSNPVAYLIANRYLANPRFRSVRF